MGLKKIKRFLQWIVLGLTSIFLLLGIGFFYSLANPSLLVNSRTLSFVAEEMRQRNIVDIRWDRLTTQIHSKFLKVYQFDFGFSNLCVKRPDLNVCWSLGEIAFEVGFSKFLPKITAVGPVKMRDGHLEMIANSGPPSSDKNLSLSEKFLEAKRALSVLQGIRFHAVEISLQHKQLQGNLEIEERHLNLGLQLKKWELSGAQRLNGQLQLSTLTQANQAQVQSSMDVSISGAPSAKFKGGRSKQVSLRIHGKLADLKNLDSLELILNGKGNSIVPGIPEVGLDDCVLRLARIKDSSSYESNIHVNCPLWLGPPSWVLAKNSARPKKGTVGFLVNDYFPTRTYFTIQTALKSKEYPFSPDAQMKGTAEIKMEPFKVSEIRGEGKVQFDFSGVPQNFPEGWVLNSNVSVQSWIPSFEKLVKNLSKSPWAIPAPFHVLRGQVSVGIEGKSDLAGGKFPIHLSTRLKSSRQKFDLEGLGAFELSSPLKNPVSNLDFQLLLSDVILELPRLDLALPPRIVPDHRFVVTRNKKTEGDEKNPNRRFKYSFEIKTPSKNPLKILSNLAKSPIPIHVQIFLNSGVPVKGFVRVKNFPLEVFRRNASVDHFDLSLRYPPSESKIDGLINVKYADYTVLIYVLSTLGKPVIRFQSDPPLPEDKILATLLFGKPVEDLDSDQQQSVGSTRAALADSALGIASLYLLASTPVQSIGYDSTTGEFTAKLRLGEGTSLNLGADTSGLEGIGIRKRLNSQWSITTDYTSSKPGEQNSALSTFLEWVHRY